MGHVHCLSTRSLLQQSSIPRCQPSITLLGCRAFQRGGQSGALPNTLSCLSGHTASRSLIQGGKALQRHAKKCYPLNGGIRIFAKIVSQRRWRLDAGRCRLDPPDARPTVLSNVFSDGDRKRQKESPRVIHWCFLRSFSAFGSEVGPQPVWGGGRHKGSSSHARNPAQRSWQGRRAESVHEQRLSL